MFLLCYLLVLCVVNVPVLLLQVMLRNTKLKVWGCTYLHFFIPHLMQLAPHKMVVAEPKQL